MCRSATVRHWHASNLVFQVAPDGRLMAYSAEKGEKLLELPTG